MVGIAHGGLVASLRRAGLTDALKAGMDRLISRLEMIPEPRRTAWSLDTLAVLYLYHPEKRDASRALDHASTALRKAKARRPDFLLTLAEAKYLAGERAEAIALLEEAGTLPAAEQLVTDKLKAYLSQVPGTSAETPRNIQPEEGATGLGPVVVLAGGPFQHPDPGVLQLRSRWQLRLASGERPAPLAIDLVTQAGGGSWAVPEGLLLPRTTYSWRVSYTGSDFRPSGFSAETSFTTGDFPWEAVPFDLSAHFNRDVVADPGDGENGTLDSAGCCLLVAGFDGSRAEDPRVQGVPADRRIGVHVLGDYAGKNALQLSNFDRRSVRIPVPPGNYSAVRFLATGGNGDSLVPVVFEYSDGAREERAIPCDDWFDDIPEEGVVELIGVLQPGVIPVLNGMDRIHNGVFEDANDPALFEVVHVTRPQKRLEAFVLETQKALFAHPPGAPTQFNLLAVTGIRATGK